MDLNLGYTKLIMEEADRSGLLRNELAYVLATAYRETARTMKPVKEAFWLSETWRKQNLRYYPWYGRGFVQLTWERNYIKAGKELGLDLTTNPDKVMEPYVSARILVKGMIEGWFTGKKLSDYITLNQSDFVGARRIINGTDKAKLIAKFHDNFLDAIKAAKASPVTEKTPEKVLTEDVRVTEDKGALGTIISATGGVGGLGFLTDIDSPYALAAFGLVVVAAFAVGYAYLSGKLVIKRT